MESIMTVEQAFEAFEAIKVLIGRHVLTPVMTQVSLATLTQRAGDIATATDEESECKADLLSEIQRASKMVVGGAVKP